VFCIAMSKFRNLTYTDPIVDAIITVFRLVSEQDGHGDVYVCVTVLKYAHIARTTVHIYFVFTVQFNLYSNLSMFFTDDRCQSPISFHDAKYCVL
jgi:hypothetical protein